MSPFDAASNCQILVSHTVKGVASSQDGPCQWADSAWWNTPTMHEMRLEGSKKEGGGLVNMTKGLLARSGGERGENRTRGKKGSAWVYSNREFDHRIFLEMGKVKRVQD